MIFFFGTNASRIGEKKLRGTTCSHCETQDSFIVTTFARYFHFFWIPIFPLYKTDIAECSHCKKSYSSDEFSSRMKESLDRENTVNPAKRPIWHGCGCIIIVLVFVLPMIIALVGNWFTDDEFVNELNDERRTFMETDLKNATSDLTFETDSISYLVQQCVNLSLDGIDTEDIKYISKINDDKLLLLLKVGDMKQIKASSRKQLVYAIEECLEYIELGDVDQQYIGVEGNWNTLMVKTPYDSDLGGKFADDALLLPFYDEEEVLILKSKKDSLKSSEDVKIEIDGITIERND